MAAHSMKRRRLMPTGMEESVMAKPEIGGLAAS
jgi:hypothetical protein